MRVTIPFPCLLSTEHFLDLVDVLAPLRTVCEAQNLWEARGRLVDELVARIEACRPALKLRPISAHACLPDAAFRILGNGGVSWRIVSLAVNILPQGVHAVQHMFETPGLWLVEVEFHKRDMD